MTDLVEATGLTKGSIYGNFENKEAVALAVFDHNNAQVVNAIQARISRADTYRGKLMVYAEMYDHFIRHSFPPGGCPVLNTAVEADDTHELLKARAAKAVINWKKNIAGLIRAGMAAGEFKPGLDPAQLALSIIALIEGGIMISRVTNSPRSLNKILKTVELLITHMQL